MRDYDKQSFSRHEVVATSSNPSLSEADYL
nr:MAG TPA: hypothetical protein [Caudoviricetes sp.]